MHHPATWQRGDAAREYLPVMRAATLLVAALILPAPAAAQQLVCGGTALPTPADRA